MGSKIALPGTDPWASQVVLMVNNPPANAGERHGRCKFNPWVGKIPWRGTQQCTPVSLPGESHEQRILGATVHGFTESDTTEGLSMHPCVCGKSWMNCKVVQKNNF